MRKLIFALLLITFFGCTEKMVTIPDFVAPESDRVILIEDFTGVSCSNCPEGSDAIESILANSPNNVIAVGIHSNFLAIPKDPNDLDLRTPEAEAIQSFLGGWRSKPEAAFSRILFDDQPNIRVQARPDLWQSFVTKSLESLAVVDLKIETDYNKDSREVVINVTATAQEDLPGDYKVHVMITEDHIIATQLTPTTTIKDYDHKHVLRKLLTDVEGNSWFQDLGATLERTREFRFTLPDEEALGWWKPVDCDVIAFITRGTDKEILQAAKADVLSL